MRIRSPNFGPGLQITSVSVYNNLQVRVKAALKVQCLQYSVLAESAIGASH